MYRVGFHLEHKIFLELTRLARSLIVKMQTNRLHIDSFYIPYTTQNQIVSYRCRVREEKCDQVCSPSKRNINGNTSSV